MIPSRPVPARFQRPLPTELTRDQFTLFRNFLYQVSGVHIPDQQKHIMDSRVTRRMEAVGATSAAEYFTLLAGSARDDLSSEFFRFLDTLTTHETTFFRHEQQIAALHHHILPDIIAAQRRRGTRTLKLWSAACSTGEEAYTLAMVALEALGTEVDDWHVTVVGTDLSPTVIGKAQRAVYGDYAIKGVPSYYLRKYFHPSDREPGHWEVSADICSRVHFRVLNFRDSLGMISLTGQHVIFCRNAFIYFDNDSRRRFAGHFHDALVEGGFLVMGHSESLYGIDNRFVPVQLPNAVVYRKEPPPGAGNANAFRP